MQRQRQRHSDAYRDKYSICRLPLPAINFITAAATAAAAVAAAVAVVIYFLLVSSSSSSPFGHLKYTLRRRIYQSFCGPLQASSRSVAIPIRIVRLISVHVPECACVCMCVCTCRCWWSWQRCSKHGPIFWMRLINNNANVTSLYKYLHTFHIVVVVVVHMFSFSTCLFLSSTPTSAHLG